MDKNRTVSDTKRSFYEHHQRPIIAVYRRVVEELMVEMHLLSVNVDFRPDPVYRVGVCESFDKFMEGYVPETDRESIFRALCQSVEANPDEYKKISSQLLSFASEASVEELMEWLANPNADKGLDDLIGEWRAALENPNFKYSRLFAIGLYSLIQKTDPEVVKDEEKLMKLIQSLCEKLSLPVDKLKKDLDLYRSNLDKMDQMLKVLADVLEASKKKKQKELLEKERKETQKKESEQAKSEGEESQGEQSETKESEDE